MNINRQQYRKLIELVNQLEVQIYEPLFDQQYQDEGHWDYVVYDHGKFLTHMNEAYKLLGKKNDLKFVDVGCGIGSKVVLASTYFDAWGIELNDNYAQIANEITRQKKFHEFGRYKVKKGKKRIIKGNALEQDYSLYDVIYFFRPINHPPTQKKLEQLIFNTAKEGAIIVPIYAQSKFPKYVKKLPTPSGELFVRAVMPCTHQKMLIACEQL